MTSTYLSSGLNSSRMQDENKAGRSKRMLFPQQPGLQAGVLLPFLKIISVRRRRRAPASGHHRTRFHLAGIRLHQQPVDQPLQSKDAVDDGNLRNCIIIFRLRPGNETTTPTTGRACYCCRGRTGSVFVSQASYLALVFLANYSMYGFVVGWRARATRCNSRSLMAAETGTLVRAS